MGLPYTCHFDWASVNCFLREQKMNDNHSADVFTGGGTTSRYAQLMSADEGHDLAGIKLRVVLKDVVAAFGEYQQFPIAQVPIEGDPLLHIEKIAPVRVHYKSRHRYLGKGRPEVEITGFSVAAASLGADVVKDASPVQHRASEGIFSVTSGRDRQRLAAIFYS